MRASRPRIGVSSCLLGEAVRYDGSDRRDAVLLEQLAPHVEIVAVCPEVELGLGVPRPPIRLEARGDAIRLVEPVGAVDLTDAMQRYARARVAELARSNLCGYVFKSRSPSCGLAVDVYGAAAAGRGLFAAALTEALPHLPVEEESRLAEPAACVRFVERVLAYRLGRELYFASLGMRVE